MTEQTSAKRAIPMGPRPVGPIITGMFEKADPAADWGDGLLTVLRGGGAYPLILLMEDRSRTETDRTRRAGVMRIAPEQGEALIKALREALDG